MALDDFGGVEFQITPIRGVRAFRVDATGQLLSVHHIHRWTSGENLADCKSPWAKYLVGGVVRYYAAGGEVRPNVDAEPYEHDMADCMCGFYGFLDGSADYHNPGRVEGVIEAYGDVYLGTRGFRTTKARIVALHIPSGPRAWMDRLTHWHKRHENAGFLLTAFTFLGGFAAYVVGAVMDSWAVVAAGMPLHFLAFINGRAMIRTIDIRDEPFDAEKIRRAYPDIPVFPTRAAMLAAFPTDTPPEKAVAR